MKNTNLIYIVGAFFLLEFFCGINGECKFPKKYLRHGLFLYQRETDANLTVAPENYLLQFKCRPGYMMKGPDIIFCFMNQWTDKVPKCLSKACDFPASIDNGNYRINSGTSPYPTIGSTAVYSCNEGYVLLNSTISTLTCTLNKDESEVEWLGEIPSCKERESCSDPGSSVDGHRKGYSRYIGDFLSYKCKEDFELVGNEKIECLPGGSWSSPRPLCRPLSDFCEMPPFIQHGVARGEKEGDYYRSDDEVEVLCELGYSYEGESQYILCQEDGEWEYEFGNCTETFCNMPDLLENGKIAEIEATNETKFPFNFELTYICDEGFRLIGDSWRFCDSRGWSGKSPYCEVIKCPDPGIPEHGTRLGNSFNIREQVVFKCFTGYELIGSFERYCMLNGQWSGELARCDHESNYCPDPGVPINGMKDSNDYDMGSVITFHCQPGFTLVGSETRECLPNGTWSGSEVKCAGPYDFDDSVKVGEILMTAMAEKEAEQKKKTEEYEKARSSMLHNNTQLGRALDLNFPGRLILYFAFDVSGSVGLHSFKKSIEFAKAIVKRIGISDNGARAGALTFSSNAKESFLPLEYKTTEKVLDALDAIEFTGGGTSANSALALVREMIPLTQRVLPKRGQKSIIFILTDGRTNMGGDPKEEADSLKDEFGAEIYCIGITNRVLPDSLYKIASSNEHGSKEEHVFILQNYAVMSWLVQKITNGTVDYSQCGTGIEKLGRQVGRGKIIGGRRAPEPWPWMAALYFNKAGHLQLQCGGSIISQKFILTAAHCLYTVEKGDLRNKTDIIVKLGLTHVKNETNLEEYEVEKYFIHSQFRYGFFDYDIAILQLKRPIEFTVFIRPICLPPAGLPLKSSLYKADHYAVAIGFGHEGVVQKNEKLHTASVDSLKEITLPLQSRARCLQSAKENNLNNIPIERIFTDRMFCAGDGNGGSDSCKGDSGGPLMQSQQNAEGNVYWIQVGIISWGTGCGLPNTYGYYTHVQRLQSWIANITQFAA